jgi:hypothetical protein
MTTDQNKATVLRFYEEVWNKGNVDFVLRYSLRTTSAMTCARLRHSRVLKDNARSRLTSGRRFRT